MESKACLGTVFLTDIFLFLSSSSPPQLMLSKVFTARTGSSIYGSLNT